MNCSERCSSSSISNLWTVLSIGITLCLQTPGYVIFITNHWFGLNLVYCKMITIGLGISSKTYLALSLYNNLYTKIFTCKQVIDIPYIFNCCLVLCKLYHGMVHDPGFDLTRRSWWKLNGSETSSNHLLVPLNKFPLKEEL